ncbi:hypothetical protein LEMLEM_LOCUS22671 [Lemmus lemmus]
MERAGSSLETALQSLLGLGNQSRRAGRPPSSQGDLEPAFPGKSHGHRRSELVCV